VKIAVHAGCPSRNVGAFRVGPDATMRTVEDAFETLLRGNAASPDDRAGFVVQPAGKG
jgi:hypothetical protein